MIIKAKLINSEDESISIIEVEKGWFTGQHVLCIHDDKEVSDTKAMHLLDKETIAFLLEELPKI
jgi:hypothetical protein